jgi:hypothetical protein
MSVRFGNYSARVKVPAVYVGGRKRQVLGNTGRGKGRGWREGEEEGVRD